MLIVGLLFGVLALYVVLFIILLIGCLDLWRLGWLLWIGDCVWLVFVVLLVMLVIVAYYSCCVLMCWVCDFVT